jgi:hypothetical protein
MRHVISPAVQGCSAAPCGSAVAIFAVVGVLTLFNAEALF